MALINSLMAVASVAHLVGHSPVHQRVASSIPGEDTARVVSLIPSVQGM